MPSAAALVSPAAAFNPSLEIRIQASMLAVARTETLLSILLLRFAVETWLKQHEEECTFNPSLEIRAFGPADSSGAKSL